MHDPKKGAAYNASMLNDAELYRGLCRIRHFEEAVLYAFPKGMFYGTTHTYLGQEANAVGVLAHLNPGDIVFSNHRCHGHFIAYGGDLRSLFAELMGKATGVCGGLGGSQHLHWKNFYSNGILGSTVPVAVGTALAEKAKGSKAITIAFLGDGALGEGVVYEGLNIASLWKAPILFILENNHIAQTTPIELAMAGEIPARFAAFGRNTEQPGPRAPIEQDRPVAVPRAAQGAAGRQHSYNTTLDVHALELSICGEPDRPAVGRPEGKPRIFRSRQRFG